MTDRKKPGVAFWVTVVVGLSLLYAISYLPATWLRRQDWSPEWVDDVYLCIYAPVTWIDEYGPDVARRFLRWYTGLVD